jgi:CarD family transcriptional regulator
MKKQRFNTCVETGNGALVCAILIPLISKESILISRVMLRVKPIPVELSRNGKGLLMFSLGDRVVYPGHGVAQISRVVEKIVGGVVVRFFELEFINKGMTVLVPTNNLSSIGLRRLSSRESVDSAFEILTKPAIVGRDILLGNWNKRSKNYQCKLRTGDLIEICRIYRDLNHLAARKELSFGEKNLLQQTEALLVEEISLVNDVAVEKTMADLRSLFVGSPVMQREHTI